MIEISGNAERQKVVEALNSLLAINFLVKDFDRESYLAIRRNLEQVEAFFYFLGWDFNIDERHELIFVKSPKGIHRKTLTREESIWMLVLRLIYEEKRSEIRVSELPVVALHEIKSKYETFELPGYTKTKVKDFLQLCKRYQLMEAVDFDQTADDSRFKLYPGWIYVIDGENVTELIQKLNRYRSGEANADEVADQTKAD